MWDDNGHNNDNSHDRTEMKMNLNKQKKMTVNLAIIAVSPSNRSAPGSARQGGLPKPIVRAPAV